MHPAALDEAALLADCRFRRQRRSGPGGQHRNKVETAVAVTHLPTGVRGAASERRSQAQNRQQAVFRLRLNLALAVRQTGPLAAPSPRWQQRCQSGRIVVSSQHDDFPPLLAEALDALAATGMDHRQAAQHLGCSPTQLVRLLQLEPRAVHQVNQQRRELGLHPLRA
jgi:hypothetical protein